MVWLHVGSDALIALAYYFIPFALIYIARKRKDLVYPWMFWLFGIFILACGTTHLMNIWVIWNPVYRLDGLVKLVTAIASVPTAILLIRLAPAVLALPSPDELRRANAEITALNAALEKRVAERTRELEESNAQLRQSEARIQAILDESPTIVYMKDPQGRMMFVNRRFETVFGVGRDWVIGKTDYDLFPRPSADAFRSADVKVLENVEPLEVEEEVYHGGRKHIYMSVKFPLQEKAGKPYALCGMSTDITDRITAQEALKKYNADLEQFAYVAAHDLQEPLRTVKTYAQLISRRYASKLDKDGLECLGFVVGGVERMSTLISDLRAYTEAAHRKDPSRDEIDLNVMVRDTLRILETSLVESGARVMYGGLPSVRANARRMGQLFQNLISNAIKYRSDLPPRVEITAERVDRDWLILVRDNGIGLNMAYAEQIFGVFKRLHGQDVPGTGIGLAICKQIVEQHGGRIWVESKEGLGSTFLFTLPA